MHVDGNEVQDGNQRIPTVGLDHASAALSYRTNQLGFLYEMARLHGPVVELWPGTVLVTGPEEVHSVLKNTNRKFSKDRDLRLRKSKATPGSQKLTEWMSTRRTVIASMTVEMLDEHAVWLSKMTDELADQMLRRRCINDITATLERVTSMSIARFCFGSRDAAAIPRTAQAMLDALFPIFSSPYEFPPYLKLAQPREWRANRGIRKMHAEVLSAAKSSGEGGLVDVLYRSGLDDTAMADAMTAILLAAHSVPAAATAWALVELARNRDEQELARAAATEWRSSWAEPPALGWVVDETLRLWPPTWVSDRAVDEGGVCGSWRLPPRSRVVLPFWVIHRLAECYVEPATFNSRRWEHLSPPPGAYVPFGGGPRRCLGARFARAEIITMLAVLLQRLSFRVEGEGTLDARTTLSPKGFELLVSPR
ncbi:cytochrome P450 [Actinomadura sp. KC06]|uniref:cytochrome P450 n=1 Tax=Actinomadura sp. KC06 TaxID=2530369 RepID=UPI00104ECEA9|nr:cytochrome P450 [Actinomadura sp. KC06]TDD30540.1 cytochrome P450 [Actinomadura sp. KC06]